MNIQINPQGYQTGGTGNITNAGEFIESQLLNSGRQISLSAGEVLSGRIAELKGNSILLMLDDGSKLSATLNGDLNVGVGQSLSFEVKSTANNQTELRPLYTNLTATPTVLSALSEAGLPALDRNVSMVQNMMQEGMSVNKQALLDMVSNLNANPSVNVETLVQMKKLELPIDESTVHQFENYKNFEHKIVGDVINLGDGLSDVFEELIASGNEDAAFTKEAMVLELAMGTDIGTDGNEEAGAGINTVLSNVTVDDLMDDINSILNNAKEFVDNLPEDEMISDTVSQNSEQKGNEELLNLTKNLLNRYLNNPESFSKEAKDFLKDVLSDPKFKDTIKEGIVKQLTLKPEEIREEGKVEALYKKILDTGNKALDILDNPSGMLNQAAKSAQNLMDNVNFMNQLNEMMTYVQLPLKMSEENAHGDLYVYTNKKKLAEKDGNLSALLHLDMDHLGPMDVYVKMQQEKVSTHFYMKDEATLDFIEKNIHILDDRLTKKGYNINTQVSVKEEQKSMVDTFLEDKGSNGTVAPILSTLSFDVRA